MGFTVTIHRCMTLFVHGNMLTEDVMTTDSELWCAVRSWLQVENFKRFLYAVKSIYKAVKFLLHGYPGRYLKNTTVRTQYITKKTDKWGEV